jgi:glycosyltransferase involved in cell wall biosynthesis
VKICLVSDQFDNVRTGVGIYAKTLTRGLIEAGQEITLLTPDAKAESVDARLRILRIKRVPFHEQHPTWVWKSWRDALRLQNLLARESFDIIHFLDARESFYFSAPGIPTLGTMHDDYFASVPRTPLDMKADYHDWQKRWAYYELVHHLEKRALGKLTHVITCSEAVKASLQLAYRLEARSITRIYYGVDFGVDFAAGEGNKTLTEKEPFILFIGGNAARKGLTTLIAAFQKIAPDFSDVHLKILGSGRAMAFYRALAKTSGLGARIRFLGSVPNEEVRRIFPHASLLAMPSLMEGFGLVFLEAMAAGVPVIGSRVGGIPEIIRHGTNGFLVAPRDVGELADKMRRLLENRSLAHRLVEGGRETLQDFSIPRMVEETLSVYQNVRAH